MMRKYHRTISPERQLFKCSNHPHYFVFPLELQNLLLLNSWAIWTSTGMYVHKSAGTQRPQSFIETPWEKLDTVRNPYALRVFHLNLFGWWILGPVGLELRGSACFSPSASSSSANWSGSCPTIVIAKSSFFNHLFCGQRFLSAWRHVFL